MRYCIFKALEFAMCKILDLSDWLHHTVAEWLYKKMKAVYPEGVAE